MPTGNGSIPTQSGVASGREVAPPAARSAAVVSCAVQQLDLTLKYFEVLQYRIAGISGVDLVSDTALRILLNLNTMNEVEIILVPRGTG